jgi:DNA repair protein RecN (Recombination protein N)
VSGLRELHLRDLGVIADVSVELSPGLNVITGETGVGKSLLMTSLALLTGARGSARLVREGASDAVVQAVIRPPDEVRAAVEEHGVPPDEELVLVRRLGADGRSRAWLGGQLVPVATLAQIGEALVQIHGQAAGFALARPSEQLAAVDALAGNADLLVRFRGALRALRELEAEDVRLRTEHAMRQREEELLRYQVDEIERAALSVGEEEEVAVAMARLEHAERLGRIGADVLSLAGTDGAAGALSQAHKLFADATALDASASELVSRLGDVTAELSELVREIRDWTDGMDADPAGLEVLRERRALISSLKRKYGGSVEEILSALESARSRLAASADADHRLTTIHDDIARARADVDASAVELTKRRRAAAKRLRKLVSDELPSLALPAAVFDVRVESGALTESGADRIAFVFSSSPSKTPDEIGKVASGGELSRAMIAVTLALAQTDPVPVLVFDEADQGIGGEAALEVGRRLARLGRSHQVLVVSHLPQIAAFADRHIAVRRRGDDVEVEALADADRLVEISRMLAGLETSELARAHAAELLSLASAEQEQRPRARAG